MKTDNNIKNLVKECGIDKVIQFLHHQEDDKVISHILKNLTQEDRDKYLYTSLKQYSMDDTLKAVKEVNRTMWLITNTNIN